MSTVFTNISRPALPLLAAGALFAALALPSAALATPSATVAVSVVENHLSIDSLSSDSAMHISVIHTDPDTIRVSDPGGTIQTGDHCLNVQDDDVVDCDITGMTLDNVQFHGSPLGDSLSFEGGWTLPVIAYGYGGNDNLRGADGNDELHGGYGKDTLRGGAGQDNLFGEYGNDTLKGGYGNDKLFGGKGNDRIFGGTGWDALNGGKGNDRLFAKGDPTTYTDTVNGGRGYDTATLDKNVDTAQHVEHKTY